MKVVLSVFVGILRELKRALPKGAAITDSSYQHVVQQFHAYQLTPEKVCRDPKAAYHQASSYLCYLRSTRLHQELLESYKGQGERSIEDAANLVGLKLPKTPEDAT
ncbi:C7orf55 [Bugula neritina]|uniref:Protein FMC1 homolog n=1 Tax=Bugula neritina TaxID=10212 RepID=A0A7J7J598_BUGNE|nr:C7orf55 [Bugula neritina]KAF6025022.1 C7orf55 [Bugula neritina]